MSELIEGVREDDFFSGIRHLVDKVLSGGKRERLLSLKKQIDQSDLSSLNWGEIRRTFYIPMNEVKDVGLIRRTLGENTLIKYFTALSGEGGPYRFTLPLESKDIDEYLRYEFSEAPAFLITDLLKKPLTPAGVNILISHCLHVPMFTLSLVSDDKPEVLEKLLNRVKKTYPTCAQMIDNIFDKRRIEYIKTMDNTPVSDKQGFVKASHEFAEYEKALFGKTSSKYDN